MRAIGIRELRQNASEYLRAVERGETIEVTNHGRPVARLTPVRADGDDRYGALIADGVIVTADRSLSDLAAPLARDPGQSLLSDVVLELRDEDDR